MTRLFGKMSHGASRRKQIKGKEEKTTTHTQGGKGNELVIQPYGVVECQRKVIVHARFSQPGGAMLPFAVWPGQSFERHWRKETHF